MPTLPQRLRSGDTLGLVAPASAPLHPEAIDAAIGALEKLGFAVKVGRHLRKRLGFLAGNDRERAADVMAMFKDKKVQGVVCLRGGYGSARLLPLLDYSAIRANPKIFVGFSDVTSLHCALLKKCNLISFHGPMAGDLAKTDCSEFSRKSWLRSVMEPEVFGSVREGYPEATISIVTKGSVSGELIGGNLSLLVTTIGTPYQPNFRGRLLFLEDVDEKPYRIDRMLTHLLNAGILQQVAGVVVGLFKHCDDPLATRTTEYRQTWQDVFSERLKPLRIPVVIGLPIGHVNFNATLPIGGRATLDANRGDLIITHPAVI